MVHADDPNYRDAEAFTLTVAGPLAIATPSGQQALVKSSGTQGISGISFIDPGLPTSDSVTASFTVSQGLIALSTAVPNGVTGGDLSGNGTGTVTASAPLAAINATLAAANGLTYTPTGSVTTDTLSISAGDSVSNINLAKVSLVAVGPLAITAPTTQQVVKASGTLGIGGVSLIDTSLPTTNNVTLNLAVANGTVALSTSIAGGVSSSQVTGNGTASVTITAPVAAINATLAATSGLNYTSTGGFHGEDTLALSASDTAGNSDALNVSLLTAGPLTIKVPSGQQTVGTSGSVAVPNISLADPSLPVNDEVTLTLAAIHGTATLSTSVSNGVTSSEVTANGTGTVTITAPLSAINATLAASNGLTYSLTSALAIQTRCLSPPATHLAIMSQPAYRFPWA